MITGRLMMVIMGMMLILLISRAMTKLVKQIRIHCKTLCERASLKSAYSYRMRMIKKAWVSDSND